MAAHGDNAVNTKYWSSIALCIREYVAVYRRTSSVGTSVDHYSVHDLATTRQARNVNTERHRRVPKWDSRICRIRGRPFSAALRSHFELCVDLVKSFVSLWYVTTGVSLSYRYSCFIDGALRHWEWGGVGWGGGWGADLSPTPPCTETMKGVVKGVKKK